MATQQELNNATQALQRYGYEVAQRADQFGNNPYLVVQDPVFACGAGPSAGTLVLMGYDPVIVRDYNSARSFINARA